jgi:hypothetical protein
MFELTDDDPLTAAERARTRTTVLETADEPATAAVRALTRTTVALTVATPAIPAGATTPEVLVPIHRWPVTRWGGGLKTQSGT